MSNDDSGFPVTDDQSKANLFNDFLSSVFSKDNNSMPKVEQFINEDTNLILFYLIRFDLNSGLTAARCRSPAAAGRPARTTDCCRR